MKLAYQLQKLVWNLFHFLSMFTSRFPRFYSVIFQSYQFSGSTSTFVFSPRPIGDRRLLLVFSRACLHNLPKYFSQVKFCWRPYKFRCKVYLGFEIIYKKKIFRQMAPSLPLYLLLLLALFALTFAVPSAYMCRTRKNGENCLSMCQNRHNHMLNLLNRFVLPRKT